MSFRYRPVLVLVFAIGLQAHAGTTLGVLAGTVLNAAGEPAVKAAVTVQSSDGSHPHAMLTDANGHFRFARFARGQYDLRAAAQGSYSEWTKRILVRPGKVTEVTLRLKK